ncbi:hypothetical protein BaOVIS_015160 [Babesia ovis]|uniref:Uncharacterized protein n=1 Tax=Babesia ovis TaxID=5869 RepID=A0A9W5T9Z4_BABOV|nr:hypothetical protein BaOVIS_015160 [Babesia ovis]
MVYPSGHSGWSVEFNLDRDTDARPKDGTLQQTDGTLANSDQSTISVAPGLHCGPAGRRTLIKWIEDNYKLRKKSHHANPGVRACRLWQESQGFSDPVAKAIVDLLKLNGVTANITYKEVFQNHLGKLLSTLIKKSADDKEKLTGLAEKMIAMFQVTEIQPFLCDLLDKLGEIPPFAMGKLLDKTSSAMHFFRIAPIGVKRKILAASPERLYETVAPLIEDALFLLDLGILEDDMKDHPIYNGYHNEYRNIISEIVELIGPPETQSSKIIYFLVQQIIRVMFMRSVLTAKSALTTQEKDKDIKYGMWFEHLPFDATKFKLMESEEDTLSAYKEYAEVAIGLVYNLEGNADETVKSVSGIRCPTNGSWNLSAVRHSITIAYQETYVMKPSEVLEMEPFTPIMQLVSSMADRTSTKLPSEILYRLTKPKKEQKTQLRIKNEMELFDLTFILSHPMVANSILTHTIGNVKDSNSVLISSQNGVDEWMPLLALGFSVHYVAACKYLFEAELHLTGEICCSKAFLKPTNSAGKPVSLTKLLSYVYPLDKTTRQAQNDLPPFLSNLIMPKTIQQGGTDVNTVESELTFHELLLMYLPRMDIGELKKFMSNCVEFYRITGSQLGDTVDVKAEGTVVMRKILEVFHEQTLDPRGHIQRMSTSLEKKPTSGTQKHRMLLEKVHGKFKFMNSTVMGILSNTANITNLFKKTVALKIIAECVKRKPSRPVVKPVLYEQIKRMNLVHLRNPTDYLCLCLTRVGFCAMNLVEFDSLSDFIANVTTQGQLAAFLPLYTLAAKRGTSQGIQQHIYKLQRVGQQIFKRTEDNRKIQIYTSACNNIQAMYNTQEQEGTSESQNRTIDADKNAEKCNTQK